MVKNFFIYVGSLFVYISAFSQVKVQHLLVENKINPLAVENAKPRLSWQLISDKRNVMQTAYEIQVSSPTKGDADVWRSGKVSSDKSVFVLYGGNPLKSGTKYYWKVRVWNNTGKPSEWSALGMWQMALLEVADWKAKWISPRTEDSVMRPSPIFRKEFSTSKKIVSAMAYVTAHGLYEAQINGQRLGSSCLTPGWTSYKNRLQYQVYDVTDLLIKGNNAIGIMLGSGWYRGIIGFSNNINVYGKDISLLFQMNITYSDGSKELVSSDESWKCSTGEIRYAEIYNGEIIDARLNKPGWALPGFNDANWDGVVTKDYSKDILIATYNEPVTRHETFKPIRVFKTPKGEQVLDFGQNLVGWVHLVARGNKGDSIKISHAEVLDKEGNFYTDNLRHAKAEDIYVLNGSGEEAFEPNFTWHGFRYIKLEGYPGEIKPENFTAVALYSDMKPTGTFTSSNQLINQLQHNIQWGQKGNFLDVPTDCPQRDERLGWTGDAQVFSRTATFNMNVNDFFAKWLKDVAADQVNGSVPFVVPNVLGPNAAGSAGWADVATIIPWNIYLAYGDLEVLEDQYNSMKAWVEFMHGKSINNLWNNGFHFGDWLFYRPEDDNDGRAAVTDKYLIAQCFYAHSTQLLINAARVLHRDDDEATYTSLLQKIKEAFTREYMTPNGRLVSGTQTAYVLSLDFDMFPDTLRTQAAARLAENVKNYDNHLTTGFLGTPYLCEVLTRFGYDSVAYKLLLQPTYPSWLYPVKMGATTIWERWDGIKPDSTFETPGMNSFNHYSYGAIGDWMYRSMVGIDTYEDGVGYKHIKIKPHIGGDFVYASASLETYYGKVGNEWKIDGNNVTMDTEIPPNTTATIFIPSKNGENIFENGKVISTSNDIKLLGSEEGYVMIKVGSGKYHFTSKMKSL
jgi:alpha-L-rhamnosidase